MCPHETRPEGLLPYFSGNFEISDSTPVLCTRLGGKDPKGKDNKTAPLCFFTMCLLENPAKTSLAVLWNMAAGPANLADLGSAIKKNQFDHFNLVLVHFSSGMLDQDGLVSQATNHHQLFITKLHKI